MTKADYGVALIPKEIVVARKLSGDLARERLEVFETARKGYNEKAQRTLNVYSINANGELVGSNVFARALLDKVSPKGTLRAGIADLLRVSDLNPEYLANHYEDDRALVLRSVKDPANSANDYVANTLAKKIGVRNIKNPLVVTNLVPVDDAKSAYGLVLIPTSETKVIEAPQLMGSNHGRKFTLYDANGLPIFNDEDDKNGKRQVWTRDSGLSRLCLGSNLDLIADDDYLANSNENGRVVELSGEATGADFAKQYQAQLREQVEARKSELDNWLTESLARMPRGK